MFYSQRGKRNIQKKYWLLLKYLFERNLDEETIAEIENLVFDSIQDYYTNILMERHSYLEDDERYWKWYNKVTALTVPYFDSTYGLLHFKEYTSAYSGHIKTRNFGENFNISEVRRENVNIALLFHHPNSHQTMSTIDNTNLTFFMEIEQNSVNEVFFVDNTGQRNGYDNYYVNIKTPEQTDQVILAATNNSITSNLNQEVFHNYVRQFKYFENPLKKMDPKRNLGFSLKWQTFPSQNQQSNVYNERY